MAGARRGKWRRWGAWQRRGDWPGCGHGTGGWKGQDLVRGVPAAGPAGQGQRWHRGAGVACRGAMAHPGEQAVGSGRRNGCYRDSDASRLTRFGGARPGVPWAVCLLTGLAPTPRAVPGCPTLLGTAGWRLGRGRGCGPSGTGGSRGAQDGGAGAGAQRELRERGGSAAWPLRVRPGEGLVRRRGCRPPARAWAFSLAEGCKGSEMCEGQKEPPCPSL